jgi:NAD(P)-dependent dehydrogenase (short-subunit alcohol dehydrogenase family)
VTEGNDDMNLELTLVNLSKSLAQEFGPKGVRVNCVSPGPVDTDLWLGEHGVAETVAQATGVDADTARERVVAASAGSRSAASRRRRRSPRSSRCWPPRVRGT